MADVLEGLVSASDAEASSVSCEVNRESTVLPMEITATKSETSDDDDDEPVVAKSRTARKYHLSDSDDEDLNSPVSTKVQQPDRKMQESSDDSNTNNPQLDSHSERKSRIKSKWMSSESDSSDEDGLFGDRENKIKSKEKRKTLETCDSDDGLIGDKEDEMKSREKEKNSGIESGSVETPTWKSSLNANLYSDGDSSEADEDSCSLENIKSAAKRKLKLAETKQKLSKSPNSRKSKARVSKDDKLREIHSESQRMVRTAAVSLPYHKPKQRSLMEFLNRKRVTPCAEECLKPRLKDYDSVVQVLEDRAKEVETFFKSDSEESETEESSVSGTAVCPTNNVPTTDGDGRSSTSNGIEALSPKKDHVIHQDLPKIQSPQDLEENARDTFENEDISDHPTAEDSPADGQQADENLSSRQGSKTPQQICPPPVNDLEDSTDSLTPVYSLKEKIENAKRLSITKVNLPTLHGRPGQLLDLDDGLSLSPDRKSKVDSLVERYVQQVKTSSNTKTPQKKEVEISIVKKVVGDDGKLELKSDVVKVTVGGDSDGQNAAAGRRQLLKESLQKSMSAKRAAERMKWMQNKKIDDEDVEPGEEDDLENESEEEILSDRSDTDLEEDEETTPDGEHLYKEKRKKQKSLFVDEEADDSDHNQSEEEESELDEETQAERRNEKLDDDMSDEDGVTQSQPKSGINSSFKISGHYSSLENLTPNLNDSDSEDTKNSISGLPVSQAPSEANFDELLALCTGKFTDAKEEKSTSRSLFGKSKHDSDEEVDELEDKAFSRIIPMEDDDEENSTQPKMTLVESDAEDESTEAPPAFLEDDDNKTSRTKRGKMGRLCFSDDEEDDAVEKSVVDEEEMHEEEREFRGLTDFFEAEAELSGSEVGSGDEREEGDDYWEEEEGDKEDLDENEVRQQVERAHFKTLLDQDQRDVRLFQELFLEDGDLHSEGGGRQRQFRWKNAEGDEGDGVSLRQNSQEEEDDDAAEDQDEATRRKMRSEREKWLQQQKSKMDTDSDIPLMRPNGKTVKVNTNVSKVNAARAEKSEAPAPTNLALSPPSKKNLPNAMVRRGSFLRRSDKDLTAIASLTKSVLPVQAPKNGNNFVFASITPERPAPPATRRKQKLEESKEDASNIKAPPPKKVKTLDKANSIFSYF